jgi:hypothetical protein
MASRSTQGQPTAGGQQPAPAGDPVVARRVRRSAWLLGLLAVAFYLGFIAATALRG